MNGSESDVKQQCQDLGITVWEQPLPPVRTAQRTRDGRVVLDFPSDTDRQIFKRNCSEQVSSNCLKGARAACSLQAMDQCQGPRWLRWLGLKPSKSWSEVEACEQQHMEACLKSRDKACQQHAEDFCELVVAKQH